MSITQPEVAALLASPILAGHVADRLEITVSETVADIELLLAAVTELRQRVAAGVLDADARTELGDDLTRAAAAVLDFALAVAA